MRESIKKILPQALLHKIRPLWHGFLAYLAAVKYFFPADKLTVIGVTGTAGKSTTIQLLAHILNQAHKKTGYVTTVSANNGDEETINLHGLSMPSGQLLQKHLSDMIDHRCAYAIIEATSEGLAQNRHRGISFDLVIFTNLAPAHIRAHGSFEKYRRAKLKLFSALEKSVQKNRASKAAILNADDANAKYFVRFKIARKIGVGFEAAEAEQVRSLGLGTYFQIMQQPAQVNNFFMAEQEFSLNLIGKFNIYNAALAIAAAKHFGVDSATIAQALVTFTEVPGRMQKIKNNRQLHIFLDYAPEPIAMQNALETISALPQHGKIIHVFGSTGGHRDIAKRFEFGNISAHYADAIIITNDDVYDSDPEVIAKDIYAGIARATDKKVKEIFTVLDRAAAIALALKMAQPGGTVLVSGKGSEQFLVLPGNRRVPWDEKSIIEKLLCAKKD